MCKPRATHLLNDFDPLRALDVVKSSTEQTMGLPGTPVAAARVTVEKQTTAPVKYDFEGKGGFF
jgi:hypothetical protein